MQLQKWYAVYTRPRWEKQVAARFEEKGITNYCPLNRVMRQWHDRKKIVLEPLFTSYVFVQIDLAEQVQVLQTTGVVNFVKWLGRPAVIKEVEIEEIRKFLKEYRNVNVESTAFKINDEVSVSSGPLISQKGKIIEIKRNSVKLFLPSLRVALYAEVDKSDIVKSQNL